MLRRLLLIGSLGMLWAPSLVGQERTPARARVWVDGEEIRPFDLLTRRRARLGIVVDTRAVENDSIGATIQSVTPGGPAAKAGLRGGDIITRLNGRSLVRAEREGDNEDEDRLGDESLAAVRLIEMVAKLEPGDTVAVEYRRDRETRTAQVVTAKEFALRGDAAFVFPDGGEPLIRRMPRFGVRTESPNGFVMAFGGPFADLELAPLNPDLGSYFGTSEGVLVINAPEKNPLGLKGGDVVLTVDGRAARGPGSLLRILRSYDEGDEIRLEIMRNKNRQTISSKLERDEE